MKLKMLLWTILLFYSFIAKANSYAGSYNLMSEHVNPSYSTANFLLSLYQINIW